MRVSNDTTFLSAAMIAAWSPALPAVDVWERVGYLVQYAPKWAAAAPSGDEVTPAEPSAPARIHPAVVARLKGLEEAVGIIKLSPLPQLEVMVRDLPALPEGWDTPLEPSEKEWRRAVGQWNPIFHGWHNCRAVSREAYRLAGERGKR